LPFKGSYISGSQIHRFGTRLKKEKLSKQLIWGWGGRETEAPNYIASAKKKISNQ